MHIESCSIYNDRIRRRLSMLVLSEHDSPCQDDKRASGFRIFSAVRQNKPVLAESHEDTKQETSICVYIYFTY